MAKVSYSLRMDEEILGKIGHIASAEDRSINMEILRAVKGHIAEFEKKHGEIELMEKKE